VPPTHIPCVPLNVPAEAHGRSAISRPPALWLVLNVAVPIPVFPTVGLIALAAPIVTVLVLFLLSKSSFKVVGELTVLHGPQFEPESACPNINIRAFGVTVVSAAAVTEVLLLSVKVFDVTSNGLEVATPENAIILPTDPDVEAPNEKV
jgi:hypothetical protein